MPDHTLFSEFERSLPHHEMILVEGGEFLMGSADEEARDSEKPVHRVTVPSFYLGKYPVTQALWREVMGNNPSIFKGGGRPIENIPWNGTQNFLKKLNKLTGRKYRLPTEAEWEFAAKGGNQTEGYIFSGSDRLQEVGWYKENSSEQTHPVGVKLANELGLHDMSGNVSEWVEGQWNDNYHRAPNDGSAWSNRKKGNYHVFRGGGWFNDVRDCQISYRPSFPVYSNHYLGFRLALSLQ